MTARRGLFWSQTVLLLAVVWSLAVAEEKVWYALVVSALCAVAVLWTLAGLKPMLSSRSSAVLIVAGFIYMIVGLVADSYRLEAVPAIALSHFMILFCVCKLLAERTLRDEGQLLLLCLFLLIIAAVTSGNMLFPVALFLYLTVGIHALLRFYLLWLEDETSRGSDGLLPSATGGEGFRTERFPLNGIVALSASASLGIGIVLFIVCPRVEARAFLRKDASSASGLSVSGFSPSVDFEPRISIRESEQPVMRVQIWLEDQGPGPADESFLYFRGSVLNQYGYVRSRYLRRLTWRWHSRRVSGVRNYRLISSRERGQGTWLLSDVEYETAAPLRTITQQYWIQPNPNQLLFSCYPPLWIGSNDFEMVRKWIDGQELQVENMSSKGIRYVVRSGWPARVPDNVLSALRAERDTDPGIFLTLPEPPLPRQAEILALIEQEIGVSGPPQSADQIEFVARRIEAFLHSDRFSYTLDPPPLQADEEPIGEFLLRTRSGHCEYFASAMVLMCRFSGIAARLVIGYQGGEFNPLGNYYLVRAKHAHAWVEVYIPGKDWVVFDPTPGRILPVRGAEQWLPIFVELFDYVYFYWVSEVMSFDSQTRRVLLKRFKEWLLRPTRDQQTVVGAAAAFVEELFGGKLPLTRRERALYWVFALLAVAGVVMVGYALTLIGRWTVPRVRRLIQVRAARGSAVIEVDFYRRFCHLLHDLGLVRRGEQTPAEFADELAERYAALDEAPDLVRAYYEVAYGRRPLSPERQDRIRAFLRKVKRTEGLQARTAASERVSI